MPRCLSEGVDIFLKSAERQGGASRTFATGGRCHGWQLKPCPYGLEPLYHFSIENSHLETRHQGMMFRSPRAFVRSRATLRYEPCTQFINVSHRALHIYWQFSAMSHAIHKIVIIKRCQSYFILRRSPHHGISKDSDLCASAHRCPHYAYARLIARVTLNLPVLPNYSCCKVLTTCKNMK